ncbi:MAG TPA: TerC family protein [Microthrixaceae bacterium]|nr:TerC family protein [Microthrixaceae bacterium]
MIAVLDLAHHAASVAARADDERFHVPGWLWVAFIAGVVVMLLVDLLVLNREAHEISVREAAITSAVWIAIGLSFSLVLWGVLDNGGTAAARYLTGYIVEKSLSVDNVFVWAVIFGYFSVPSKYQHRVLFWGIFGALVMRAIFIFAGAALLDALDWMMYVFGAVLLYTAVKVFRDDEDELDPEANPVLKLVRRFVPLSEHYEGQKLFTRHGAKLLATPLFVVLVMIEITDVIFAVDSVPAILSISGDRFILFSSNALAILGLRALYFLLEAVRDRLVYLPKGLGIILFYVGVKMIVSEWVHIDPFISLAVILGLLTITVVASLRATRTTADVSP